MFPRSFLFFIIIMVIDIILKSAKDKKKIEKAKDKRMEKLSKTADIGKSQQTVITPKEGRERLDKKRIGEKPKPLQRERLPKMGLAQKETFPIESYESMDIIQGMEGGIKKNRTKYSNKKFKKDLLKGIIFSEILSEPKGLKNKRRSI